MKGPELCDVGGCLELLDVLDDPAGGSHTVHCDPEPCEVNLVFCKAEPAAVGNYPILGAEGQEVRHTPECLLNVIRPLQDIIGHLDDVGDILDNTIISPGVAISS